MMSVSKVLYHNLLIIAGSKCGNYEAVVSKSIPDFLVREELQRIYNELESLKFEVCSLKTDTISDSKRSDFNKFSVINSTREKLAVHFEVNELLGGGKSSQTFVRLLSVKNFNSELLFHIESIKKNPRLEYLNHTVKDYFDSERFKKIYTAHFQD